MQEDEKFLSEVFAQLTDEATDDDKRRELVSYFLKFKPLKSTYSFGIQAFNTEFVNLRENVYNQYETKDIYLNYTINDYS